MVMVMPMLLIVNVHVRIATVVRWLLLMGWLDFDSCSTLNTGHSRWRDAFHRYCSRWWWWYCGWYGWSRTYTYMQITRQTEMGNVVVVRRSKSIGRRRRQMVMARI
jgi:hypothetical protein